MASERISHNPLARPPHGCKVTARTTRRRNGADMFTQGTEYIITQGAEEFVAVFSFYLDGRAHFEDEYGMFVVAPEDFDTVREA